MLLEPFSQYPSVLDVEHIHLFHPFEKWWRFDCPKINKKCKKWPFCAFFPGVSPNDHLNICFNDQQGFTESILVLYILRYLYFKAKYPEKQGKWPWYAPEWPYLVLFGHFFCWNLSASIWACFMSKGCAYFTHLKKWWWFYCPKNDQKMKKWPF